MKRQLFKEIAREEALLLNRVFLRNRELHFNITKEKYSIIFLPTEVEFASDISIRIGVIDFSFWITLDRGFMLNLIKDYLNEGKLFELPAELRDVLIETVLENTIDQIENVIGSKMTIEDVRPGDPEEREGGQTNLFFHIMRHEDGPTTTGRLSLNLKALKWFVTEFEKIPIIPITDVSDIPLFIIFEVGRTRLSLGDINEIEKNDLIIMDERHLRDQNRVIGRVEGGDTFLGIISDSTITIEKFMEDSMADDHEIEENNQSGEEQPDSEAINDEPEEGEQRDEDMSKSPVDIDEIQIDLLFELGRKKIQLKDLKLLKPGYTFDFATSFDKPVDIRANGQRIGSGEVVSIDNRIGVRVIEFFGGTHDGHA